MSEKPTNEAKKVTKKKTDATKVEQQAPGQKRKPQKRLTPQDLERREALKAFNEYAKAKSRYFSFMRKIVKQSKVSAGLFTAVQNGEMQLSGTVRREVKKFEEDFILEIEKAIPSLETIVMNPHKFLAEIAEEVQIEKAKRITPRAVQHLAQNSQNVDEILPSGVVVPKRVLNVYVDDDLKIYENRFIMTLIARLQVFIELRYKYIYDHGDSKNSDVVELKKEVKIGEHTYLFEGKMQMVVPSDDDGKRNTNNDLLERLTSLRRRSMFLVSSPFMKELRKATPVQDPIQQTNIIRLNYLYQDAFRLWQFINRYDELGIEYKVTQARVDFNDKYIDTLNHLVLASYLALDTEHATVAPKDIKQYTIKPRVTPGKLDYELDDGRFSEAGLPVAVKTRVESQAQKEARLKREAARAKAKEKKALERQKEREKAAAKRRREKEKLQARKKAAAERARLRKLAAQERQKERDAETARRRVEREKLMAEKRAFDNMLKEEARKLREARKNIKKLAEEQKKEVSDE